MQYNYCNELFSFYDDIVAKKYKEFSQYLKLNDINVINNFRSNKENIHLFYDTFINKTHYDIFLCGINPGRKGAGETGIPFMDFDSLRNIFKSIAVKINFKGSEPSANFFQSVVSPLGIEDFYRTFYITNVSPLGFNKLSKSKRIVNLNYYELPTEYHNLLMKNLLKEITYYKPKVILPLGEEVEITLNNLKHEYELDFEIGERIRHPSYCSRKRLSFEKEREHYYDILNKYV
jgi:uracil-DNA glycosylase